VLDSQTGYTSVAAFSCRRTRFKTIPVNVEFVLERLTLGLSPSPSNSVYPIKYRSTADDDLFLTYLPQNLYNLMFTHCLSFPAPVTLVFSFYDVIEKLSVVEFRSVT
jgi:hypothetical protein